MLQLLVIAVALLIGLLSTRLMKIIKLPNVTGYLIAGILIGPCVLGLALAQIKLNNGQTLKDIVYNSTVSNYITTAALGFIAFSIGSSFKKSSLKAVGGRVIIITVCEALAAALFVIGGLFITKIFINDIPVEIILTLGAISCATAPAATLMVIKQYNAKGPLVNTLLPVVAFDDAVALIAFEILFSISKAMATGTQPTFTSIAVWPLLSIIASLAIGGLLGYLVTLGCKFFKSSANRMIMCIIAILIGVGISALPWSSFLPKDINFSTSGLLTCMMIGAIFVNTREDSEKVFSRVDMITPPIYMLFFVISGASLDLTIFASPNALIVVIMAATYLVFRVIGKWLGAYASSKATHAEPTVQKYLGFALIPQAGVAIGLATTATNVLVSDGQALIDQGQKIIGQQLVTYGGMILAIILTSTLVYELTGPLITKFVLTKAGEIAKE